MILSILWSTNTPEKVDVSGEFWLTNYDAAIAQAKKEQKIVMLYFSGSDWCKPCIIWKKEVLDTDVFQSFASNKLVPVKLDFPRLKKNKLSKEQKQLNEKLAGKYNNGGVFPFIVFLDDAGNVIEKTSYRQGDTAQFIAYVETVIAKSNK